MAEDTSIEQAGQLINGFIQKVEDDAREQNQEFYLACVYLDKAIPVYGRTNTERIRAAADEIIKLRSDIERIGRERDDMARAAQELQERLSRLEDDHK